MSSLSFTSTEGVVTVRLKQVLCLQMLSLFASVIAPFGGFFASGFKRGFKIKDFGDSIPGHGGMTDRMDCQVRPPAQLHLMLRRQQLDDKNWLTLYHTSEHPVRVHASCDPL